MVLPGFAQIRACAAWARRDCFWFSCRCAPGYRNGDIPQARTELDRGRGERVLSPKFSRRLGPNRCSWATTDSSRAIVPTSPAGDGLGDDPVVTIRPADGAGLQIRFAHEHPLVADEAARMRRNPRNHIVDLVDPRLERLRAWRDAPFAEGRGGSTIRRQALIATAAPAQREEARQQPVRPLAHPGSRRATGSTARQTWSRVRDSRRRRPSRP